MNASTSLLLLCDSEYFNESCGEKMGQNKWILRKKRHVSTDLSKIVNVGAQCCGKSHFQPVPCVPICGK